MRIITGKLKGRRLQLPLRFPARPTTDFARTGLFNILDNRVDYKNNQLLNLFAGSGIIAFEYVSRGGRSATCVDINPVSSRFIEKECQRLGVRNIFIVCRPVHLFLKQVRQPFDIIFADPPFNEANYPELLDQIFSSSAFVDHSLLIIEHSGYNFTDHPYFFESRRYGRIYFSFFKKKN